MTTQTRNNADKIAALNDRCRLGLDRVARRMITANLKATLEANGLVAGIVATARLMKRIREYDFGPGDGPERDFGAFDFDGNRVCFKIDYYDHSMEFGSEDPSDPSNTVRVMTIMLTSDY